MDKQLAAVRKLHHEAEPVRRLERVGELLQKGAGLVGAWGTVVVAILGEGQKPEIRGSRKGIL